MKDVFSVEFYCPGFLFSFSVNGLVNLDSQEDWNWFLMVVKVDA